MTIWDFLASEQFKTIASALNALVLLLIVPLYRGIRKHIAALNRIPLLETILSHHDERISELETHRANPPRHQSIWPSRL